MPPRRSVLAAVLFALAALACDAGPAAAPAGRPAAAPGVRPPAAAQDGALERIEIVTGGAAPDAALPILVAVHGLGDSPEGLARLYEGFPTAARVVLPRAPERRGSGGSWFPLPWEGGGSAPFVEGVARAAARVAALCAELAAGGASRPVLTGFSQGGILTFAVAASHPERISAAAPIAGWLPPELVPAGRPPGSPPVRIRAFHGGADDLLRPGPTRELVERLRRLGFDVRLRVYPGVPHAISAEMRRDYFAFLAEVLAAPG
jgi:phospholipase/carboxylesterase